MGIRILEDMMLINCLFIVRTVTHTYIQDDFFLNLNKQRSAEVN